VELLTSKKLMAICIVDRTGKLSGSAGTAYERNSA
jgi:hypothetical protein